MISLICGSLLLCEIYVSLEFSIYLGLLSMVMCYRGIRKKIRRKSKSLVGCRRHNSFTLPIKCEPLIAVVACFSKQRTVGKWRGTRVVERMKEEVGL